MPNFGHLPPRWPEREFRKYSGQNAFSQIWPISTSMMCPRRKCGESVVLPSYSGWHHCKSLGTWSEHHQNNSNIWWSPQMSQKRRNLWAERSSTASHPGRVVTGSAPGHSPGLLLLRPIASTHSSLDVHTMKSWRRRLIHTAGEKGKPKSSTAGGSIYEQLPGCLTAHYIISVTWQPAVPKTSPWGKSRHVASDSPPPSGMIMRNHLQSGHSDLCKMLSWKTQLAVTWGQSNSIQHELAANTQESC